MMKKRTGTISAILVIALWVILTLGLWLLPSREQSEAERRPLAQMPEFSISTFLKGGFAGKFEDYTLDQFPLRDSFRSLKSVFSFYGMQQKDNNDIYIAQGYAAKLEYPLNQTSVNHALKKFNEIYEHYLQDTNSRIWYAVIPDKGYYLAEDNGYPVMDYEQLMAEMAAGMPWAESVDITGTLSLEKYYRTDTHWRQEELLDTAKKLCDAMGIDVPVPEAYSVDMVEQDFYGVYYGQSALPLQPEEIYVMNSSLLEQCRVFNYETGEYGEVYDLNRLTGNDPYDVYLSGAQALLTIENPLASTQRELILFRDSFGSSLAPLLVQGYAKVTLVDIRYVSTQLLANYLDFHGQDVLFAYSTLILNSSSSLK